MGILTLKLDKTFDYVFAKNTFTSLTGELAIVQRISNKILLWLGEWFINSESGFDWEDVFQNAFDESILAEQLRAYIQSDEFIEIVTELTVIIENDKRLGKVVFSAITADGDTLTDIEVLLS